MIAITGAAQLVLGGAGDPEAACDSTPWLRERKSRKYMGLQDELAVVAAGRALSAAGLCAPLGSAVGLYMAVGYIPFERRDAQPVLMGSIDGAQRFSMERFASDGYLRAHPLVTFRCLPNMPAYHVSANFGIEGPYVIAYPGPGQMYLSMQQACAALEDRAIEVALCGGVAHQRNFLVEHHYARLLPEVTAERLRDAAGFVVLELAEHARARGARLLAALDALDVDYRAFDPRSELPVANERWEGVPELDAGAELGPASLPIAISRCLDVAAPSGWQAAHVQLTRDGYSCHGRWSAP